MAEFTYAGASLCSGVRKMAEFVYTFHSLRDKWSYQASGLAHAAADKKTFLRCPVI